MNEVSDLQLKKLMKHLEVNTQEIEILKKKCIDNVEVIQELEKERNLSEFMLMYLQDNGLYSDFKDYLKSFPLKEIN